MVVFGFLRLGHLLRSSMVGDDPSPYSQPWWWIWAGISLFLVLFAGVMSGLTLGLMSLGLVDLEVLQQSGTDEEREQACMLSSITTTTSQLFVGFHCYKLNSLQMIRWRPTIFPLGFIQYEFEVLMLMFPESVTLCWSD